MNAETATAPRFLPWVGILVPEQRLRAFGRGIVTVLVVLFCVVSCFTLEENPPLRPVIVEVGAPAEVLPWTAAEARAWRVGRGAFAVLNCLVAVFWILGLITRRGGLFLLCGLVAILIQMGTLIVDLGWLRGSTDLPGVLRATFWAAPDMHGAWFAWLIMLPWVAWAQRMWLLVGPAPTQGMPRKDEVPKRLTRKERAQQGVPRFMPARGFGASIDMLRPGENYKPGPRLGCLWVQSLILILFLDDVGGRVEGTIRGIHWARPAILVWFALSAFLLSAVPRRWALGLVGATAALLGVLGVALILGLFRGMGWLPPEVHVGIAVWIWTFLLLACAATSALVVRKGFPEPHDPRQVGAFD